VHVRAGGWGRRIALALLATLVAATTAACEREFARRPPALPTGITAERFAALWPEQDLPAAAAAQRDVRDGDAALTWRIDPARTARRFATSVLGWPDSIVAKTETWVLDKHEVPIARVWLCEPEGCPAHGAAFDQQVILKRLVDAGSDGVWSVTDVTSGRILLDESPLLRIKDPKVRAGRRMRAFTTGAGDGGFPDGARVIAGSAYRGGCGTVVESSAPAFRFQRVRFQVAAMPDTTCGMRRLEGPAHGYVFIAPRTRAQGIEPASLFTRPRSPDASPLHDLTAIAVRFLPRDRVPAAPPAWLSRDPATLPGCRANRLRVGDVLAGPTVPGFGVGIFVDLGLAGDGACHVVVDAALRLRDGSGAPIELPGARVLRVDGYLPGYLPGRDSIPLGWGLFGWCGRMMPGPIRVTIAVAGQVVRASSDALARFCPSRGDHPTVEHVPVGPSEIARAVTAG
jgi:hypothetical protein